MEVILGYVDEFRHMKFRTVQQYRIYMQKILQLVSLAIVIGSALSIWKSLQVVSLSECPVVVVLSDSMVPAYGRGDILFLTYFNKPFEVGDVIVYKLKDQEIPIVHRVLQIHKQQEIQILILTKGDNNQVDDRALYPKNQMWLKRSDIMGKIQGFLPYVGHITIYLNDYPYFKFVMIGLMSLFVLTAKDPQS
ncbi:unnamed protein product (macronuclear) [Paramecium tetraurelia]|uniref:Signal peptidase complex catalytic subunit SEC11 n=1 Tax=Paramecium tetraurelia TaxID=5888 RepID=A0DL56_PARTE|nr:uncharacterized protein GSPATT00018090001 [Paramecium tetraurelia]CAK83773.1 unnamed protein product [Paramecium tetraurelia]|eukprot:XP_001451170.1 hypothetical protein (macronuclear) [Paramecium tetraurelia strain d4-2]